MRLPFRFVPSYRAAALLVGVTPRTAYVEVSDGRLLVRFGLWRLETPISNVTGHEVTGGFRWLKTAGPPHVSLADRGVSFATNGDRAVCVRFAQPVAVWDPTGRFRHPAATLTVADPEALVGALRSAG